MNLGIQVYRINSVWYLLVKGTDYQQICVKLDFRTKLPLLRINPGPRWGSRNEVSYSIPFETLNYYALNSELVILYNQQKDLIEKRVALFLSLDKSCIPFHVKSVEFHFNPETHQCYTDIQSKPQAKNESNVMDVLDSVLRYAEEEILNESNFIKMKIFGVTQKIQKIAHKLVYLKLLSELCLSIAIAPYLNTETRYNSVYLIKLGPDHKALVTSRSGGYSDVTFSEGFFDFSGVFDITEDIKTNTLEAKIKQLITEYAERHPIQRRE